MWLLTGLQPPPLFPICDSLSFHMGLQPCRAEGWGDGSSPISASKYMIMVVVVVVVASQ